MGSIQYFNQTIMVLTHSSGYQVRTALADATELIAAAAIVGCPMYRGISRPRRTAGLKSGRFDRK
jgi:hypothetical protein